MTTRSDYGASLLNLRDELIVESAEIELALKFNPKFTIDGNQYCYLYGDDLQTGISGFGDTVLLALLNFYKNIRHQKVKA